MPLEDKTLVFGLQALEPCAAHTLAMLLEPRPPKTCASNDPAKPATASRTKLRPVTRAKQAASRRRWLKREPFSQAGESSRNITGYNLIRCGGPVSLKQVTALAGVAALVGPTITHVGSMHNMHCNVSDA